MEELPYMAQILSSQSATGRRSLRMSAAKPASALRPPRSSSRRRPGSAQVALEIRFHGTFRPAESLSSSRGLDGSRPASPSGDAKAAKLQIAGSHITTLAFAPSSRISSRAPAPEQDPTNDRAHIAAGHVLCVMLDNVYSRYACALHVSLRGGSLPPVPAPR